jgi:hypothetical protein
MQTKYRNGNYIWIILLMVFLPVPIFSQSGLHIGYVSLSNNDWDPVVDETSFFEPAYTIGLDYAFRLPNIRIEFRPMLSYFQGKRPSDLKLPDLIQIDFFTFQVQTVLYPLNLEGDCNCPTFSKQGTFLDKGLFVMAAPGLVFAHHVLGENTTNSISGNHLIPQVSCGAGIDFGISEHITITPFGQYSFLFSSNWEDVSFYINSQAGTSLDPSTSFSHLNFGIRMAYHWR